MVGLLKDKVHVPHPHPPDLAWEDNIEHSDYYIWCFIRTCTSSYLEVMIMFSFVVVVVVEWIFPPAVTHSSEQGQVLFEPITGQPL